MSRNRGVFTNTPLCGFSFQSPRKQSPVVRSVSIETGKEFIIFFLLLAPLFRKTVHAYASWFLSLYHHSFFFSVLNQSYYYLRIVDQLPYGGFQGRDRKLVEPESALNHRASVNSLSSILPLRYLNPLWKGIGVLS